MAGCDWYGFNCLNSSSTIVKSLNIPNSTCGVCQAGSCADCRAQDGCGWYSSSIPGVGGKCDVNTTENNAAYTLVNACPACLQYDGSTCQSCVNHTGCNWYVLPGNLRPKCREASPSFAYTQVPSDSCDNGNRCAGIQSCKDCQSTNVTSSTNSSACAWYKSKQPNFYDAKCDDNKAGVIDNKLYDVVNGVCPQCAGTSCTTCKAEAGCKWVAVQAIAGTGSAFGECVLSSAANPSAKTEITTCPADCDVHSCNSCVGKTACRWFSGSQTIGDSCDLASDATIQHPFQSAIPSSGHEQCGTCQANRCFECNGLTGCGWYVEKILGVTTRQGCFATGSAPAGRELRSNTDSKCDGVPSSSAHVMASLGIVVMLALFA